MGLLALIDWRKSFICYHSIGKFHDKKRLYARIQRTDIKGMEDVPIAVEIEVAVPYPVMG